MNKYWPVHRVHAVLLREAANAIENFFLAEEGRLLVADLVNTIDSEVHFDYLLGKHSIVLNKSKEYYMALFKIENSMFKIENSNGTALK